MRKWQIIVSAVLIIPVLAGFLWASGNLKKTAPPDGEAPRVWEIPERRAYYVQMGAFSTREAAESFSLPLRARGAAGYILEGAVYRSLGALYAVRSDAQAAADRLRTLENMEACVYEESRPARGVELVCTRRALNALVSAESALWSAAEAARDAAFRLDRGEIAVPEAQALLRAALACAQGALAELNAQSPKTSESLADALSQVLQQGEPLLSSATPALTLSADLKQASLLWTRLSLFLAD